MGFPRRSFRASKSPWQRALGHQHGYMRAARSPCYELFVRPSSGDFKLPTNSDFLQQYCRTKCLPTHFLSSEGILKGAVFAGACFHKVTKEVKRLSPSQVKNAHWHFSLILCMASGLNNEDGRQSAPFTETLYCTSTRRASSRYAGEIGTRNPPQQRMKENCLWPHMRTCTQPTQRFAAGAQLAA